MKKIFTFSFDDGTVQDKRLIAMLKKYGFTATFNLSSGLFGYEYSFDMNGHHVVHTRLSAEEAKEVYKGFEVAAHTRTHNCLRLLPRKEIIEEVVPDYIALSELFGYPVRGLAYAWGGTNYDRLSTDILQNDTNIRYARNVEESGTLNFPENFLEWHPSAHILSDDTDRLLSEFEKAENEEHARRAVPKCEAITQLVAALAREYHWCLRDILSLNVNLAFQFYHQILMRLDGDFMPPNYALHMQSQALEEEAKSGR